MSDSAVYHECRKTELRYCPRRQSYAYQCLECGRQVGACVSKKSPLVLEQTERVFWDDDLAYEFRETYRWQQQERMQAQQAAWQQAREAEERARRQNYDAYMRSDAWRAIRAEVLRRANNICQGCGKNKAVHVHHLTYDHFGNEFLWELVAVCRDCHQRAHPDKDML